MRAEIWECCSGNPLAAEYAARDANVINTGNAVYACSSAALASRRRSIRPRRYRDRPSAGSGRGSPRG
jgi:hypothetical protein